MKEIKYSLAGGEERQKLRERQEGKGRRKEKKRNY